MTSNNKPLAQRGRISFATLKKLTSLMDENRVHHLAYGDIVIDKMLPVISDPIEAKASASQSPIQQIAEHLINQPKSPQTLEEQEYDLYEQLRGLSSGNQEGY